MLSEARGTPRKSKLAVQVLIAMAATANVSEASASWPPLHHGFTCNESPAGVAFTPDDFAGTWYMQKSTKYNKEKYGCVTWAVSEPDSSSKVRATFRYMKTFDWWPFWYDIGQAYAED